MSKHIYILFFLAVYMCRLHSYAQTPYDTFAPEAYRQILELDASTKRTTDSIVCLIVPDVQNQLILFVDTLSGEVLATATIIDNIQKWLSVDPLTDKYPNISPYAYCMWNPIMQVDPDGK